MAEKMVEKCHREQYYYIYTVTHRSTYFHQDRTTTH